MNQFFMLIILRSLHAPSLVTHFLHPFSHLLHLYNTFVTPALHICYTFVTHLLHICYSFVIPLLNICHIPCYIFVKPLLHICNTRFTHLLHPLLRLRYTVVTLIITILMHSYSVAFCPVFVLWHFVRDSCS